METEGSLPHSQEPVTCLCPEPNQSSPRSPHPVSWRSILLLSSNLRLGRTVGYWDYIAPMEGEWNIGGMVLKGEIQSTWGEHL
jgi:hypothetical protein